MFQIRSYGNAPAISGGGRLLEPLQAVFQAQAGNCVQPPTFRKPAGLLSHVKEFDTKLLTLITRPRGLLYGKLFT